MFTKFINTQSYIYQLFLSFGVDLAYTPQSMLEVHQMNFAFQGVIFMLGFFLKFLFSMVKQFMRGGLM